MARLNIDTGTAGNPATGDTLRTAMTKINTNFSEVYSLVRDGSSGLIATDVTNGDLKLQANGTGSIEIDTLSVQNSTITSIATNSDITLTPNGTGNVVLGNFTFNADQTVGAGQDNYVFTYDHSTGTIGLEAAASGGVSASSTTTFTNKTFDANGTGNSISNIEVADFAGSAIINVSETLASNDSDTALVTAGAIIDYVDAQDANIASDTLTFTNKSGNISQWTNDSNYATQAYVDARDIGDLAVTGSTISAPSNADLTLTTSGTGSVSVDGIQIKGTELSSSDSTQITIKENLHVTGNISGTITGTVSTLDADSTTVSNIEVDNFKASAIITVAETLASNDSDTALVTAGAIIDYVDAQDANIASDTLTFTNKTFDVEGTGNSISNIDVADFKAAAIVTAAEGIGSNNNDTTIPTSAAVKAYADSVGGSTGDLAITGSTISAPSNADLTLNAGGTGSVDIEGIQIKGTEISSTDSTQVTIKENLNVTGTITGSGAGIFNVETIAVKDESSDTTCFPLFSTGATSLSSGLPVKTDQSSYKYNASTGTLEAVGFRATGSSTFDGGVEEKFATLTGSTGTVTHNCDNGHVFYHTGASGDITANFTNLGLTAEYGTNLTVIINQGATPYEVTAVQIGGAAQTINWQGGSAPTGNANGIDSFSFTILNDGGTYVVLGQMVDFT